MRELRIWIAALGGVNMGGNDPINEDDSLYARMGRKKITGVSLLTAVITVARENLRSNAEKTRGKSMIILGAGLNHWYHMDMSYRGIINHAGDVRLCWSSPAAAGRIM